VKRLAFVTLLCLGALAVAIATASEAPQRQAERPAVVWAVGDGANGSARAKLLARRIARDRPDRFLYLGDVYPAGSADGFRRGYEPVYGALSRITEPTPGNHDWGARRSGYYPYWKRAKGRAQAAWYRLSLAGWEILALNSQAAHGEGSSQLRWLRSVLRRGGTCRLAFWHRPRFSAGRVHGDAPDMEPVWNALRGRARLVVNGHEHNLQRFKPRDGLTEYVAGAGGHVRYGLRRDPRLAFGRVDVDGALRVELRPGRAGIEFRSTSGRVLDRSEAGCRAGG
jgi:Calcineurin-like phosphoesterase